ncbi:MAG TPA: RNA polymerase sigma factor [Dehalococcoidia bacterium]|nr:RNA polymerase sigma factor [Dehalococcoidia bacterium]
MAQTAFDSSLIAAAKAGDREAFAEIYRRHSQRVYRHVCYITGDPHEADDLTNETFIQAWKSIPKYEDRGVPIEHWLLRIGHRMATHQMRRRKLVQDIDEVQLEDSSERRPERLAELAGEAETLRAAVIQLPEVQRQVIIWRFIEGMSYDEAAELLGKSSGAIRVIQFRALRQLREILSRAETPARLRQVRLKTATSH